jgi:cation transporter-like permease
VEHAVQLPCEGAREAAVVTLLAYFLLALFLIVSGALLIAWVADRMGMDP